MTLIVTFENMPHTYQLVLYCDKFPTLKNSKQLKFNGKTKKLFITASEEWAIWQQEAALNVNVWKAKCKYPLPFKRCSISIICFFPNWRVHDLDGILSGILDLLKTPKRKNDKGCGVILDDDWKLLRPLTIDGGYSPTTPRIEVFITPVDDLTFRSR